MADSESDRISFIAGQVQALRAFAHALAELSRDGDGRLAREFELAVQGALVSLEKTRADKQLFEGFQDTAKRLRGVFAGKDEP